MEEEKHKSLVMNNTLDHGTPAAPVVHDVAPDFPPDSTPGMEIPILGSRGKLSRLFGKKFFGALALVGAFSASNSHKTIGAGLGLAGDENTFRQDAVPQELLDVQNSFIKSGTDPDHAADQLKLVSIHLEKFGHVVPVDHLIELENITEEGKVVVGGTRYHVVKVFDGDSGEIFIGLDHDGISPVLVGASPHREVEKLGVDGASEEAIGRAVDSINKLPARMDKGT